MSAAVDWKRATELLKHLQKDNDREALDEIVVLTIGYVFRYAFKLTEDPHLANELTQEVFLAFTSRYYTIKNPQALPKWLKSVTWNLSNKIRPHSKESLLSLEEFEVLCPSDRVQGDPLETLIEKEKAETLAMDLKTTLGTLPPVERQCVELIFMEGRDASYVARKKGVKRGTVYTYLSRGLKRLSSKNLHLRKWL